MPISATRSDSERPVAEAIGLAIVLLLSGFALERSGAGQWASDGIAIGLARVSAFALAPIGFDLIREGVELRSLSAGWALRVSEVCDGIGLIVALVAMLGALHWTPPRGARAALLFRIVIGVLAIMVFNLVRVMVLAVVLGRAPAAFEPVHVIVFPFLTLVLLSCLCLPWRRMLPFWALTFGFGLVWQALSGWLAPLMVAPANLVLGLFAPRGIDALATTAQGATVIETTFIAGRDPVALYSLPIQPSDFMLALPVVLAATLLTRRYWAFPLALVAMGLALVCGALTVVWTFAETREGLQYLVPAGAGEFLATDYVPPGSLHAAIAILQNTLVHFNLLVLPILMLAVPRRRDV